MDYAFESLGPVLRYIVLVFMLAFALIGLIVIVFLAALPGQIAKRTKHPQADAINVCGWLGLPTGVLWAVAMVWAFTRPGSSIAANSSLATTDLDRKLNQLEQTIQQVEKQFGT